MFFRSTCSLRKFQKLIIIILKHKVHVYQNLARYCCLKSSLQLKAYSFFLKKNLCQLSLKFFITTHHSEFWNCTKFRLVLLIFSNFLKNFVFVEILPNIGSLYFLVKNSQQNLLCKKSCFTATMKLFVRYLWRSPVFRKIPGSMCATLLKLNCCGYIFQVFWHQWCKSYTAEQLIQ